MRTTLILFVGLLTLLSGCAKDDESADIYPVWILNVRCFEDDITGILQPVRGCPQVIFHTLPNGRDSTVGCVPGENHRVKVWNHLDSVVTISYYVRNERYWDSPMELATFYESNAIQRPDRPGREHEVNVTLIMEPR